MGDGEDLIKFFSAVLHADRKFLPWTLTNALRQVQVNIVEWLRGLGYEVKIA